MIPTFQADIDHPGHQIHIKFRNCDQAVLFTSIPKAESNAKNFRWAAQIIRQSANDEPTRNLADWLDEIAGKHKNAGA